MNERAALLVAGNLAIDEVYGEEFFGGRAGNIATNTAQMGTASGIISNIGKDGSSRRYAAFLEQMHVDTTLVTPNLNRLARCVIASAENHSSSKEWFDNGTTEALRGLMINSDDHSIIKNADYLHLTTVPPELMYRLVEVALGSVLIGYEPGPRIHNDFTYFDTDVLEKCDVLFLNEEEAATIDGRMGLDRVRSGLSERQAIVVTRGQNGAAVLYGNSEVDVPSVRVIAGDELVDSSGAGDAFKSGFYVGLSKGADYVDAARLGNEFGMRVVRQQGAILDAENVNDLKRITNGMLVER